MYKRKKTQKERKRRRTSLEIEEEQTRTLYIRIPHTIKDVNEIKNLFFGNFRVKLPRQSSRYCHVIFSNIEEKLKNLKAIKKKVIDGKPIYAGPPKPPNLEKKLKPKPKKIVIPEPSEEPNLGRYLFISRLPSEASIADVRDAFPGCVTLAMFKGEKNGKRKAKVKMSSTQACLNIIKNESDWPIIHGKKVHVALSRKTNNNNRKKQKKEKLKPLKIFDEEVEQKNISKTLKKSENKNNINNDDVEKNMEHEENIENEEDIEDEDSEDEQDVENSNEEMEDSDEELEDSNEEE